MLVYRANKIIFCSSATKAFWCSELYTLTCLPLPDKVKAVHTKQCMPEALDS